MGDRIASMGPRLVSRGKLVITSNFVPPSLLQWGRDLLVAESGRARNRLWHHVDASMGPRLVSRGKAAATAPIFAGKSGFNGAATC